MQITVIHYIEIVCCIVCISSFRRWILYRACGTKNLYFRTSTTSRIPVGVRFDCKKWEPLIWRARNEIYFTLSLKTTAECFYFDYCSVDAFHKLFGPPNMSEWWKKQLVYPKLFNLRLKCRNLKVWIWGTIKLHYLDTIFYLNARRTLQIDIVGNHNTMKIQLILAPQSPWLCKIKY
jgi:hypothetical protein